MAKKGAKKQKVETPTPKGKKGKPVKPVEEEEESSSEEEEVQAKPQKKVVPAKAAKKVEESSEEDSDDSEEEEVQAPQKKPVKNAAKNGKKAVPAKQAKKESSSEEESDDDDEEEEEVKPVKKAAPAKKVQQTKVPQKKMAAVKKKSSSSEEESSSEEDSSGEEEEVVPKPAKKIPAKPVQQKKAPAMKKRPAPKEESSSEEDSSEGEDESSEEEVTKPTHKAKAKPAQKKPAAQEESEDDEDDSDEEEDEEMPQTKAAVNGAKKAAAADDDEDDSDDDEEDDSDDDDDDEEEETVKAADSNKRKKEKTQAVTPAKKAKVEANGDAGEAITLFVGNLDKETEESDVSQFFLDNGVSVAECRKPPGKMNAFVDLANSSDLDKAMALNGSEIDGRSIKLDRAKPKGAPREQNNSFSSPGQGGNDSDTRTLFVKGLPEDATADGLRDIFDTAADVRLPMKDGYHKGFGFIEFSDATAMEAAMSEKQGADMNGSSLYLDYMGQKSSFKSNRGAARGGDRRGRGGFDGGRHANSGSRGQSKVLFVGNLSWDTEESTLVNVFEGAKSARIPTFPDSGKPKGFAFVEFDSTDQAASAYDSMNGESVDGRQVKLDFAADKGDRGSFGGGGGFGGGDRFSPRGRGGGRGGGRGFGGGRGRGGDRGRGGRGGRGGGGFNKARGGIVAHEGKKMTFNDSD